MRFSSGFWRYSDGEPGPSQGWKIHVSASILTANKIFSRVRPILKTHQSSFKVPKGLDNLDRLNSGLPQYSQVGKFLTIYPATEEEAVALAAQLHRATRGLSGPEIPFDVQFRRKSLVYYRYGAFGGEGRDGVAGREIIVDPAGRAHPDRRTAGSAVPAWLVDPFRKVRGKVRRYSAPIGVDLLPYRALAQRGKGGVYEALDFSVSPVRRVIVKEGRRHGETGWDGADGYDRMKHEARVLRALGGTGVQVPHLLREFTQNGSRYLVLERIVGRRLLPAARVHPQRFSWRRSGMWLDRLEPLLAAIHAAGWVWRDCKPSHIFMQRGGLRLIDFEGACRIDDTHALQWSSPNYTPPGLAGGLSRRAGTREDDYALGMIAFQFGTGNFPPADDCRRVHVYNRTGCPKALRERIEALLRR